MVLVGSCFSNCRYGLKPCAHAYASAVHACAKRGMWEEGLSVLDAMINAKVKPTVRRTLVNATTHAAQKRSLSE